MKKSVLFSIVLLVVLTASQSFYPQSKFEGKAVIETSGMGGAGTLNYFVKGKKIRFDVSSARGEANILFDQSEKKMYMIMPSMKMYMEFPMDMIEGNSAKDKMNDEMEKFEKTGVMKKINGYNCEKWTMKEDKGSTEAWMTRDLGSFIFFDSPMGKKSKSAWKEGIEESGYFPMKIIQKNKEGEDISTFEVKSIEKKKLEDSFFKVPEGYSQMKMPSGSGK